MRPIAIDDADSIIRTYHLGLASSDQAAGLDEVANGETEPVTDGNEETAPREPAMADPVALVAERA